MLAHLHRGLAGDRGLLERLAASREAWARLAALAPHDTPTPEAPLWIALGWELPTDDRRALARLRASAPGGRARWIAGPVHVRDSRKRLRGATGNDERGAILASLEFAELAVLAAVGPGGTLGLVEHWVREGRHVQSVVDGSTLLAAGVPEGPSIGRGLAAALAAARNGASPDEQRAAALNAARPRAPGPEVH